MKISRLILTSFMICISLFADNDPLAVTEESLPRLNAPTLSENDPILVPCAKGLILVSNKSELLSSSLLGQQSGFHVMNVDVPGGAQKLEKELVPLYLNKSLRASDIEEIQDTIRDYYHSYHRPFVVVDVPEQDVTDGVIQIVVFESRLSEVKVQGNKWSSPEKLQNSLHVCPGEYINQKKLLYDLDFLNRNPFRRADIVYAPGEQDGTTDVILHLEERSPYRIYAGAENTGVPSIHRQRYFTGFNWGNAFGLGHMLAYQFTASYNIHRFQSHTLQYVAPLPWQHVLDVYGGASWIEADLDLPSMRSKGFSAQASARYKIPFLLGIYLRHDLIFGFDFKRTNNTIEFVDDYPSFGKNVNLTQLSFEYGGIYERKTYRLDFELGTYFSPGKWISDQTNADFRSLRPGAKNHWVYFSGALGILQRLPKSFSIYILAKGQYSPYNLLPSEQFGLGGYDTVRGYNMRELSTESGYLLSSEVRSPAFPVFHYFKWIRQMDAIQFLLFFDYGYGRFQKKMPFEEKGQYLIGVGPGLRYTLEPYFSARLDWGIKLHHRDQYGGGASMVHFSITGSF